MNDMQKVVLSLCPTCNPRHVLENGRLWGLCMSWRLVGDYFTEEDIKKVVLSLPARKLKKETAP